MKRIVVLIALVYTVFCLMLMPLQYKNVVREQRIDHPSHDKDKTGEMTLVGVVTQEHLEKQWVYFKTVSGACYQIRYKNVPGFAPDYFGKVKLVVATQFAPYGGVKNFSGFDNDRRLYADGIDGAYSLKSYEILSDDWTILQWRLYVRRHFTAFVESNCTEPLAGFYKALLLGDKGAFESYSRYMAFGLAHLFAVSGLHFGLVYAILNKVLWLGNRSVKTIVIVLVMSLLLFWVGPSYSAIRAFFIILYVMVGKCMHKNVDLVTALSLSCLVLLIIEPRAVMSTAFQLSFYAYLIIALVLDKGESKWLQGIKVQGYLLPPTLYFFGQSHVLGFALNAIAIPTMGILLPLSLMHLLALKSGVLPLARVLAWPIEGALLGFDGLLQFLPEVYVPRFMIKALDYKWAVLWCFGLLFCYTGYRSSLLVKRYSRQLMCVIVVGLIGLEILKNACLLGTVSVVDVGHGDGAVLESKGNAFLIDLGDGYFDFASYLNVRGIYSLEGIAITHAHKDHYGGLENLLKKVQVKKLYVNAQTYEKISEVVKPYAVKVEKIETEQRIQCGKITIDLFPFISEVETNDNGLFLDVRLGDFNAYFAGDFSKENLSQLEGLVPADLVKVPHHGSKTSTSLSYYDVTEPEIASISHGKKYGLPDEEALEPIVSRAQMIHSTYYDGELRIFVTPWHFTYKTFLKTMFYTP